MSTLTKRLDQRFSLRQSAPPLKKARYPWGPRTMSMTIAAGFKCTDGIVLSTDTKYSLPGDGKTYGPKIFPVTEQPKLSVIVAGSGVVAFMKKAVRILREQLNPKTANMVSVRTAIELALRQVHVEDIYLTPNPDEWGIDLLVGVWTEGDGLGLFKTVATTAEPVLGSASVGYGKWVCDFAIEMIGKQVGRVEEAKVALAFGVKLAKDHAEKCGGDTRMMLLNSAGRLSSITKDEISEAERYAKEIFEDLSNVMMTLDTKTFEDESALDEMLARLRKTALGFRKKQTARLSA